MDRISALQCGVNKKPQRTDSDKFRADMSVISKQSLGEVMTHFREQT
jgi:hypothetical protein